MMRARRHTLPAAMLIALALAVSPAHAQDREATAVALQKFDEGRKQYEAGQFEAALLAFEASNSMLASPNSLLYMARCYRALGRVASAYVNYQLSARQADERMRATGEKRYAATSEAARNEVAEIAAKVPHLMLVVPKELPREFVVKQNGRVVPPASFGTEIETDPGVVTIEAEGRRTRPFRAKIEMKEGARERVEIIAERLPTAILSMQFVSRPAGLALEVDGVSVDAREWNAPNEVDVGVHKVVARAPGYVPFAWSRSLSDRERADVPINLAPEEAKVSRATPKWLFFTVAGASVVTLSTGGYLAFKAQSMSDEEQSKNPLARDPARRDRIGTQSTVANVLFASGALLGAGAGVLLFTTKWKDEREAPRVGAWIDGHGGGLSLKGPLR